jgi:hypothetical protein
MTVGSPCAGSQTGSQDRWLLFDWSNRVIGYQDPDYAASAEFDPAAGTPMTAGALALRPVPDSGGRMPDPQTREGIPDLYAYACWRSTNGGIRATT